MGEVMTQAIIGMPYDMAMSDELSRRQFHDRAQYLLGEHEKLQAEMAKLRAELERLPVDGFALVPVEPTPEMVSAAEEAHMPFGDMDIALRMAILSAPSAPATVQGDGWIPIIERLPNVAQEVIVFSSFEGVCAGVLDSYDEWFAPCSEYKLTRVTHWMPLPKSPEASK